MTQWSGALGGVVAFLVELSLAVLIDWAFGSGMVSCESGCHGGVP